MGVYFGSCWELIAALETMGSVDEMETVTVDDPLVYFDSLGGLHDAEVLSLDCNFAVRTVRLSVDDINSNFVGLPEYPGLRRGVVVFERVESVLIDIEPTDGALRIYDIEIGVDNDASIVLITLSPAGRLSWRFETVGIEYPSGTDHS